MEIAGVPEAQTEECCRHSTYIFLVGALQRQALHAALLAASCWVLLPREAKQPCRGAIMAMVAD